MNANYKFGNLNSTNRTCIGICLTLDGTILAALKIKVVKENLDTITYLLKETEQNVWVIGSMLLLDSINIGNYILYIFCLV